LRREPQRQAKANSGGDFDNNIYTYSLPFFAGPGLSSQTQPEYNRGIARDSIKTHSLSPSSLGLEKFSSQTQLEYNRG
jgi:hypothetical protein